MTGWQYDIIGVGSVAVDDLLYVAEYPPPDSKTRVLRRVRQCGGLTGTALVAAARAGARCCFAGVVGTDELSDTVAEQLERMGVSTRWMARAPAARVIHSVIVVEQRRQTRTIFYDLEGALGALPDWPPEEAILSARALYVDHLDCARSLRAARLASSAGIPVIADFEYVSAPEFEELLGLVNHLILPAAFAAELSGEDDPAAAARALWSERRALVAVTCGVDGVWWVERDAPEAAWHQPAFPVETVDTTGCGDVFHGAYAAALAHGLDAPERIRFAAAAAALKATAPGGQAGIPSRADVEAFLAERAEAAAAEVGAAVRQGRARAR